MQKQCWRGIWGLAILAAIGLTGCPGPQTNPSQHNSPSNQPPTTGGGTKGVNSTPPASQPFKVGLVFDKGGKDDKSFNASADAGLEEAEKELNIPKDCVMPVESHSAADYKTNLTNLASQNCNLVIAVGFAMSDAVQEVAPQYPNTKFAIVDADAPAGISNVEGLRFQEEQGCFLAGFLAASMSKTKTIGFVGGMKIPLIEKFEAGYKAGAKTAGLDPDKQVLTAYTGDWDSLDKGKRDAEQEFAKADIIFHAAGKAGQGVIDAAQEKGAPFYAIGCDQDQDYIAPGRVLTSMVKHVDTAVLDAIKGAKEGKFTPGTHIYTMKDGGISLSEMKYTRQDIPPDVQAKLEKLSDMVKAGTVTPPTRLADLAAFKPPTL